MTIGAKKKALQENSFATNLSISKHLMTSGKLFSVKRNSKISAGKRRKN